MLSPEHLRIRSVTRVQSLATFVLVLLATSIGYGQNEKQVEPYDGQCEAPVHPEAIASLVDEVIESQRGRVGLILVRHPQPSSQPADARTAWVCTVDGKPRWVIANLQRATESKSSGLTARAIQRARQFVAETEESKRELRGTERARDWHPIKESLRPTYQSKEYGLQITELKLIDQETESWEVTVKPVRDRVSGGEIWMRFSKGNEVSAEFGR